MSIFERNLIKLNWRESMFTKTARIEMCIKNRFFSAFFTGFLIILQVSTALDLFLTDSTP